MVQFGESRSIRSEPGFRPALSAAPGFLQPDRGRTAICGQPARSPSPCKHGARTLGRHPDNGGRPRRPGGLQHIFPQGIPQHCFVQRQVHHKAFELRILFLKLLQPSNRGDTHDDTNILPPVKLRLSNTHLAAELANWRSCFRLLQGKGNLFV